VPTVSDVRLTLIWTETNLALVAEPQPKAPLASLGRKPRYEFLFESVRRGDTGTPITLELPWPAPADKHLFWRHYLNVTRGRRLDYVKSGVAWDRLVPLRVTLPCDITISSEPARVAAEGFFYPHGIALVVTVHARGWETPRELPKVVDLLHGIVNGTTPLSVAWMPRGPRSTPLDRFATRALGWLRETALGAHAEPGIGVEHPYSVTTFVRVDQVDATVETPDQGRVHKALEAVTTWLPNWRNIAPEPMANRRADIRGHPASHVCYVGNRGVAVWFPTPALAVRKQPRLSCYHRNQVFAALQIESISGMLVALDRLQGDREQLSPTGGECEQNGALLCGWLYGKTDMMYHTGSSRKHIELRDLETPINKARERHNMDPLH
jgi:hypothetical protein